MLIFILILYSSERSVSLFFTILNMNILFINVKNRKAQIINHVWKQAVTFPFRPFFTVFHRLIIDRFSEHEMHQTTRSFDVPVATRYSCQVAHIVYFMLFNRYIWAIQWQTPCRHVKMSSLLRRKANQVARCIAGVIAT